MPSEVISLGMFYLTFVKQYLKYFLAICLNNTLKFVNLVSQQKNIEVKVKSRIARI